MVSPFYRMQLREAVAALKGFEENADIDTIQKREIKDSRMRAESVLDDITDG